MSKYLQDTHRKILCVHECECVSYINNVSIQRYRRRGKEIFSSLRENEDIIDVADCMAGKYFSYNVVESYERHIYIVYDSLLASIQQMNFYPSYQISPNFRLCSVTILSILVLPLYIFYYEDGYVLTGR